MTTNVDFETFPPLSYEVETASFELHGPAWDLVPPAPPHTDEAETDIPFTRNDLGYFMNLAGRHDLLTAEEERRLGRALWIARRRLLRLLRRAKHTATTVPTTEIAAPARPVTPSTRRRLARVEALAYRLSESTKSPGKTTLPPGFTKTRLRAVAAALTEMEEIRRALVERNLRLVVWVAKRFRGRGFDFIDLIQEGNLGLMRAVDRYDPTVGARFSTFATHWIQQGIRRALAEKARTIRIPVNRIPEVRETLMAQARLGEKLGRRPENSEISREIGLPEHKLAELLPAIAPIHSIDAPIAGGERNLGDTLDDRDSPTPFDETMEAETNRSIEAVLHALPERQRVILSMRHGIGYPKECTLEEIGEALGLSRERIRQVEKVATVSVREWLEKHRPQLAQPL